MNQSVQWIHQWIHQPINSINSFVLRTWHTLLMCTWRVALVFFLSLSLSLAAAKGRRRAHRHPRRAIRTSAVLERLRRGPGQLADVLPLPSEGHAASGPEGVVEVRWEIGYCMFEAFHAVHRVRRTAMMYKCRLPGWLSERKQEFCFDRCVK